MFEQWRSIGYASTFVVRACVRLYSIRCLPRTVEDTRRYQEMCRLTSFRKVFRNFCQNLRLIQERKYVCTIFSIAQCACKVSTYN